MKAESEFRSLLMRIGKLLSREDVRQLVFMTMRDIDNRQLSEECVISGNALGFFQAMIEKDLYSHNDPTLLLQHLEVIGRHDALRMIEQEMGVSSQWNHFMDQQKNSLLHPGSGAGIPTSKTGSVPNHINPRPAMDLGRQAMPLPLESTQAPRHPNDEFKDGACNLDTETTHCYHRCAASTKVLEPEASLSGDATSPRNHPDIHLPEQPPQDTNRVTKGSSPTGLCFQSSEKKLTAARNYPDIPERPPRESIGDISTSSKAPSSLPFPIPESQKISIAAVPHQTVPAARPDATYMYPAHQQHPLGHHRPQEHRIGGAFQSGIEVEQRQGRPPPVPERPPRRPKVATYMYVVEELELSHLSRNFNAEVVDLLGHELGFGAGRISQLKYENPHDISQVFYRLMVDWRSAQHGGSNMRENLANHLRNIKRMGLADDLEGGRFRR